MQFPIILLIALPLALGDEGGQSLALSKQECDRLADYFLELNRKGIHPDWSPAERAKMEYAAESCGIDHLLDGNAGP